MAVSVYVVVEPGATVVEPEALVEVKAPGVIAIVVAPEAAQDKVADEPAVMLAGFAVKEEMAGALGVGGGGVVTPTVTAAVTEPAEFAAVKV